ncbi:transposase [Algoriphagus resistens]|uniref:transposase n=1 Tax=Algoriphagus resistens TaxID=1750590 RepID=UPI0009EB599E
MTCETEHKPFQKTGKSVGIDTGIKELAILSDGSSYENIRSLKTKLKKLRFGQRQLSKKTKGSRSRGSHCRHLSETWILPTRTFLTSRTSSQDLNVRQEFQNTTKCIRSRQQTRDTQIQRGDQVKPS